MTLALILLAIEALLEPVMVHTHIWHSKKVMAVSLSGAAIIGTSVLLTADFSFWTLLFSVMTIYRVVNLARLIQERMNEAYLSQKFQTSSLWLSLIQAVFLLASQLGIDNHFWLQLSAAGLALLNAALLLMTMRNIRRSRPQPLKLALADRDMPSLTVAIPARNETQDLQLCLQSLIRSNYPKLEILVLDDCSQNKRTPEIIRQFAHDGVRFISGIPTAEGWLAKNYAYNQLTEQANGELLLFCGVDTRFKVDTLRILVLAALQERANMVSALPCNHLVDSWNPESLLVQPNRYAWELALPRRLFKRPPVLSTCWLIKKDFLRSIGGFNAVRNSIVPESYFARQALASAGGYRFIISSPEIGLSCDKQFSDQRDTAIRVRYPQMHRRPELVGLMMLLESWLLLSPFVGLIVSLIQELWVDAVLYGLSGLFIVACYSLIIKLTYRRFIWRSLWLLPVSTVYDLILLNYSMWQYEFNEVIWKGRNVCIPMMHVVSHLPKI